MVVNEPSLSENDDTRNRTLSTSRGLLCRCLSMSSYDTFLAAFASSVPLMMNLNRWLSSFSICLRYSRYFFGLAFKYSICSLLSSEMSAYHPAS